MLDKQQATVPAEIISYYNMGKEAGRLIQGAGKLEFARTQELIRRHIALAPATVLDVGGGAGVYAFWLAELGYEVHLIDAVPLHIEQAQTIQQTATNRLASANVGDARQLMQADNSVDAVLMLGPLYHLTERADRVKALREAYRVLKPGGVLFAAAISRYASFLDGLNKGFLSNPVFLKIVEEDLQSGQHRGTTSDSAHTFFTTSFFHHPHELADELNAASFDQIQVVAIEGLGWLACDFDALWENEAHQEAILQFIGSVETEPTLIGASSHLMGIGRKAN